MSAHARCCECDLCLGPGVSAEMSLVYDETQLIADTCGNGHVRTAENTRLYKAGKQMKRKCRDCERARAARRRLSAALVLCIGCGAAPAPVPEAEHASFAAVIAAEEAFPALELEQQDWAIAEWNRALGGQLFWTLQVGGVGDWSVRRTVIDQCSDGPSMGCTHYAERRIDIDSWGIYPVDAFGERADIDWSSYRNVMLHELGHALGAKEHARSGLMGEFLSGQNCVDQAALDALAAVRELPEGSKPTCR